MSSRTPRPALTLSPNRNFHRTHMLANGISSELSGKGEAATLSRAPERGMSREGALPTGAEGWWGSSLASGPNPPTRLLLSLLPHGVYSHPTAYPASYVP